MSIEEELAIAKAANVELLRINMRIRQKHADLATQCIEAIKALGAIRDTADAINDAAHRALYSKYYASPARASADGDPAAETGGAEETTP